MKHKKGFNLEFPQVAQNLNVFCQKEMSVSFFTEVIPQKLESVACLKIDMQKLIDRRDWQISEQPPLSLGLQGSK